MSKCSVLSTWKSKLWNWTLFCPKYCAPAGEPRKSATQHSNVATRPRVVLMGSRAFGGAMWGPPVGAAFRRPVSSQGEGRERLPRGHQHELAAVDHHRARRAP